MRYFLFFIIPPNALWEIAGHLTSLQDHSPHNRVKIYLPYPSFAYASAHSMNSRIWFSYSISGWQSQFTNAASWCALQMILRKCQLRTLELVLSSCHPRKQAVQPYFTSQSCLTIPYHTIGAIIYYNVWSIVRSLLISLFSILAYWVRYLLLKSFLIYRPWSTFGFKIVLSFLEICRFSFLYPTSFWLFLFWQTFLVLMYYN